MSRKVSIIVPVYNVSLYIKRCINSIASQTYKNIEVIFIDDCGSDDSVQQVEDFLSDTEVECKLVRHEHNQGLSAARNSGLEVATGDYVFFLDSDDEITHDCIELLVNPLKRSDYDIIVGDYISIGGVTECLLLLDDGPIFGNDTILTDFLNNRWYAMVMSKLYRLDFIRDNGLRFKDGIIHEDELWSFAASLCAERMYVNKVVTYKYYVNNIGSIMTTNKISKQHYNSWATILLEMVNCARLKGKYEDYNVFNYIEVLKTNITCEAYRNLSKNDFREYYEILSKEKWDSLKQFFKKRLSYKRAFKDLCFYLPNNIGYIYLFLWYKLTLSPITEGDNYKVY